MRNLSLVIVLLLTIYSPVLASTGSLTPCSKYGYSLFYSPLTEKVYMGCTGGPNSLELQVINPISLNIDKSYLLDGLAEAIIPINNGNSLIVLLSCIDDDPLTEDGELRQIAYSDGHTENSFPFSTIPLAMVIDSQENFAYITSGLDEIEVDPIITKIDLSNFQKIGNDVVYGRFCDSIAITNDDSKLYIKNDDLKQHAPPDYRFYREIGVFNTSDMSPLTPIQLDSGLSIITMGYDNRLYASSATPEDDEVPLVIVDTLTDTITEFSYPHHGLFDIAVDATNRKLYCSVFTEQWEPEIDEMLFMPSPVVLEIDLENQYSYREMILGSEPIWLIKVAPISDPIYHCRLFGKVVESPKVYYMDVD